MRMLRTCVSVGIALGGSVATQDTCSAGDCLNEQEEAAVALQVHAPSSSMSSTSDDEFEAKFAAVNQQLEQLLASMDDSGNSTDLDEFQVLSALQAFAEESELHSSSLKFKQKLAQNLAAKHRDFVVNGGAFDARPELQAPPHPVVAKFQGQNGACYYETGVIGWQKRLAFGFISKVIATNSKILNAVRMNREEAEEHLVTMWQQPLKQYTHMQFATHLSLVAALSRVVNLPMTEYFWMNGAADGTHELSITRFPKQLNYPWLLPQSPMTIVVKKHGDKKDVVGVKIGDEASPTLDEFHAHAFMISYNSEASLLHLAQAHYQVGLVGAVIRQHLTEDSRLRPLLAIFTYGADTLNEFTSVSLVAPGGVTETTWDLPSDVAIPILGDTCGEFNLAAAYRRGKAGSVKGLESTKYVEAMEKLVTYLVGTPGALQPGLLSALKQYNVDVDNLSEAQVITALFYVATFEHMMYGQYHPYIPYACGDLSADGSYSWRMGDAETVAGLNFRAMSNNMCVQDNYDYLWQTYPKEDLDQWHLFQDYVNEFTADGNILAAESSYKCIWRSCMQ